MSDERCPQCGWKAVVVQGRNAVCAGCWTIRWIEPPVGADETTEERP